MDAKIPSALSHPRRTAIFDRIRERDGTSEGELAAELGIGVRAVEYHLKILRDAALIAPVDGEPGPGAGGSYVATSTS